MALKDDFSHKIAASEQNICDQEAILTLHQQTLERVTHTGELPFDFTMTEFKSKMLTGTHLLSTPTLMATKCASKCMPMATEMEREHISQYTPT